MSNFVRLTGNLAMLAGLILFAAFGVDYVWIWFGGQPWAFCGLFPSLTLLAWTMAIPMAAVGLVAVVLSGDKNGRAGILILGGLIAGAAPGLIGRHLGGFCGGG